VVARGGLQGPLASPALRKPSPSLRKRGAVPLEQAGTHPPRSPRPRSWKQRPAGQLSAALRSMITVISRVHSTMPLTERRPRGPEPPRIPGSRGAAAPRAATTWKLCIQWKLRTSGACFISAGCKISTLTAGQAPVARPDARLLPGARASTAPPLPQVTALLHSTQKFRDRAAASARSVRLRRA
jgi:hypothetical protein